MVYRRECPFDACCLIIHLPQLCLFQGPGGEPVAKPKTLDSLPVCQSATY